MKKYFNVHMCGVDMKPCEGECAKKHSEMCAARFPPVKPPQREFRERDERKDREERKS